MLLTLKVKKQDLTLNAFVTLNAFDGLAFGYFRAGLEAEARSAFRQAKELKPGFNSQFNANNYKADAK